MLAKGFLLSWDLVIEVWTTPVRMVKAVAWSHKLEAPLDAQVARFCRCLTKKTSIIGTVRAGDSLTQAYAARQSLRPGWMWLLI